MATDDDDAATLRERVRELEATVAQQQDTIEQLMPSRRAILAGGAGLVGGAALTGQASAQSAAGQVGTSSEPVDVEAASVTADSVNTTDLFVDNLSTRAFLSSSQSIADSALATVNLDTIDSDDFNGFDTNTNQFVAPKDGDYFISAAVNWASDSGWSTGDSANIIPQVNGNNILNNDTAKVSTGSQTVASTAVVDELVSGDEIDLRVFQSSGSSKQLSSGVDSTQMTIVFLG